MTRPNSSRPTRPSHDRAAGRSRFPPRMCRLSRSPAPSGFLDAEYFDDVMASAFRDGTIAEAPVMPGVGLFMPAGSAAFKDKGLFRRNVPEFHRRSLHRLHGMRDRLPGRGDPEFGA